MNEYKSLISVEDYKKVIGENVKSTLKAQLDSEDYYYNKACEVYNKCVSIDKQFTLEISQQNTNTIISAIYEDIQRACTKAKNLLNFITIYDNDDLANDVVLALLKKPKALYNLGSIPATVKYLTMTATNKNRYEFLKFRKGSMNDDENTEISNYIEKNSYIDYENRNIFSSYMDTKVMLNDFLNTLNDKELLMHKLLSYGYKLCEMLPIFYKRFGINTINKVRTNYMQKAVAYYIG